MFCFFQSCACCLPSPESGLRLGQPKVQMAALGIAANPSHCCVSGVNGPIGSQVSFDELEIDYRIAGYFVRFKLWQEFSYRIWCSRVDIHVGQFQITPVAVWRVRDSGTDQRVCLSLSSLPVIPCLCQPDKGFRIIRRYLKRIAEKAIRVCPIRAQERDATQAQ